jgi:hypothetical protein
VLDGLWRRLGIDKTLAKLLGGRKLDARAERVLFALVANRAIGQSGVLLGAVVGGGHGCDDHRALRSGAREDLADKDDPS